MKKKIAIKLENITKKYTLHHDKPTFAENILKKRYSDTFTALDSVDLTIYKGEKIGIIGQNGAGKTTLLKIMSEITTPDSGRVKTNGKIISLMDLEAGFHPDLTGEENIFLNGLIVGMTKNEISQKLNTIVKFANIGSFIDAPLYTYSNGMKLRLGFSVAINADPDILILDESVVAGDEEFQRKANKKINSLFKHKTIIMVSHWLEYLEKHTNRILWLDKGKIVADGNKKIFEQYVNKF